MSENIFRDWQHASRLFLVDSYKYSPKVKFLYHVTFYLSSEARRLIPQTHANIKQIGMLAKSVDLPKYSSETDVINMYNRKKHYQKHITYQPINIMLHDDNQGLTRSLLEGYYRYYFVDGGYEWKSGAYGDIRTGDNAYKGSNYNLYPFGMDNGRKPSPFFEKIEISQLARGEYFMYTLARPILTDWGHDHMDYSEGNQTIVNNLTVVYDGVEYSHGNVDTDMPVGFNENDYYDTYGS